MSSVQGSDWGSIVIVLGMTLNSSVVSWAWRFHPLLSRAWRLINCCYACEVALSGMLMRVCQVESYLHGKGVDSLDWYGSHFWVCITFCEVRQYYQTDWNTGNECWKLKKTREECVLNWIFELNWYFIAV
jgi:hypothetical protein